MTSHKSSRLVSLDLLRGITISGMLLVNNPGSWGHIFAPLEHAEWIGLTPTDLVFPFFIFVMGVSMYLSLRKFNFKPSIPLLSKVAKRAVILFLIGWAVQWFSHFMRFYFIKQTSLTEALNYIDTLRILGVFQRLALVSLLGSLVVIFVPKRAIAPLIFLILAIYALILHLGNGYEFSPTNILACVDTQILGANHMYHESVGGIQIALDPEGLLSTLPCVAHVLIGFRVGQLIYENRDNHVRIEKIFILGTLMLLCGWLLQYGIPCGKKMWSTTFVLITSGMACCILSLLIYAIDIKGKKRWFTYFHSFGVNPLFIYLAGTVLAIVFSTLPMGHNASGEMITIHSALYDAYVAITPNEESASLCYALTFNFICWLIGYPLYRKQIYIKI